MNETHDYTPRPITITRDPEHPDRYRLTYAATVDYDVTESYSTITWHDAVLALEYQRPTWRPAPDATFTAPHPAIAEILEDIRWSERAGIAAYTITAEPRTVISPTVGLIDV